MRHIRTAFAVLCILAVVCQGQVQAQSGSGGTGGSTGSAGSGGSSGGTSSSSSSWTPSPPQAPPAAASTTTTSSSSSSSSGGSSSSSSSSGSGSSSNGGSGNGVTTTSTTSTTSSTVSVASTPIASAPAPTPTTTSNPTPPTTPSAAAASTSTSTSTSTQEKAAERWPSVLSQKPEFIYVAEAPPACSADLISKSSWGVATAAYQIEGAYKEGKKSLSIWDNFVRQPGKIRGGGTGDVAIDHYNRYPSDFKLMKDMGINVHRFSISWPRIIPGGRSGSPVNEEGVAFYNKLIDEMIINGITPVATMYHWDLPQVLQDTYKGWLGDQIVEDFNYYAATLFSKFGNKIKFWVTINEPPSICDLGYKAGIYAPGMQGGKWAMYKCGHNTLLAHAAAVRTYRKYFSTQGAKIGFSTNVVWPEPMSNSFEDKRAANNKLEREFGWLADPLFFGDYPTILKDALKADLPTFTDEQKALLKGSVDFIGVNVYTARYVFANPDNPQGFKETKSKDGKDIGEMGGAAWLLMAPSSLAGILKYVGSRYNKAETWVTEFGTGITGELDLKGDAALKDTYRTNFYSQYLQQACQAISDNKLNVPVVFAWSLWDNFEWAEGYEIRYGMVGVDFKTQVRTVKESGYWWATHFFRRSKQLVARKKK